MCEHLFDIGVSKNQVIKLSDIDYDLMQKNKEEWKRILY